MIWIWPCRMAATMRLSWRPSKAGCRARLQQARADLVIYIAGADPYKEDRLGRLSMTKAGLAERDRIVFENCRAKGLPVAVVMGGGYARDVNDVVDIHFQTIQLASQMALNNGYRSEPAEQ